MKPSTPIPWTCERHLSTESTEAEARGRESTQIMHDGWQLGVWIDSEYDGPCPNSAFIVHAVNHYQELVDALTELLDALSPDGAPQASLYDLGIVTRAERVLESAKGDSHE